VRLKPGASKNCIGKELIEGALPISVRARPVENAANKALVELLSKALKVPKSSVEIIIGHSSKSKVVEISGINKIPEEIYGKCL
jgi:uncharacterized protein YggU (UPF0235/DUF167 family)